jgi:hypothetical protein
MTWSFRILVWVCSASLLSPKLSVCGFSSFYATLLTKYQLHKSGHGIFLSEQIINRRFAINYDLVSGIVKCATCTLVSLYVREGAARARRFYARRGLVLAGKVKGPSRATTDEATTPRRSSPATSCGRPRSRLSAVPLPSFGRCHGGRVGRGCRSLLALGEEGRGSSTEHPVLDTRDMNPRHVAAWAGRLREGPPSAVQTPKRGPSWPSGIGINVCCVVRWLDGAEIVVGVSIVS